MSETEARGLAAKYGMGSVVLLDRRGLAARFGPDIPADTLWSKGSLEWCTALGPNGCVFLADDGGCRVYRDPLYPEVCKRYPWSDIGSGPTAHDASMCPEPKG